MVASVHCDWASWGLLQTFNIPCRGGARGSPGRQRAPWDGDGQRRGVAQPGGPPFLEFQGSQKEPPHAAWPRWVVASLGGKPSGSFLLFLSRFESSRSRV